MSTTKDSGSLVRVNGWELRFLMAINDAIPRGEIEPFADYLGVNYNTMKCAKSPHTDSMDFKARWLPALLEYFNTDEPMHVLARMRGGLYLPPIPGAEGVDGCDLAMAETVREVGEMMTKHASHQGEGSEGGTSVTRAEWRARARASYRATVALTAYHHYCQRRTET